MADYPDSYDDTPIIPGTEYHVHDPNRPHPASVSPGDEGLPHGPPSDAEVLLDATDPDLSKWQNADGGPAGWNTGEDGVCVSPGAGDIRTEKEIGDCQLHIEWATPTDTEREGEGRGNSGVFLMDRYEIQVLDCHTYTIYADGYAGAIYGQYPPLVNACRPPGEWQSFDLRWRQPRFESGSLEEPARLTLFHNGVLILEDVELHGPTGHKTIGEYEPHGAAPLRLQDHGDRVCFRNAWYRPLGE